MKKIVFVLVVALAAVAARPGLARGAEPRSLLR